MPIAQDLVYSGYMLGLCFKPYVAQTKNPAWCMTNNRSDTVVSAIQNLAHRDELRLYGVLGCIALFRVRYLCLQVMSGALSAVVWGFGVRWLSLCHLSELL